MDRWRDVDGVMPLSGRGLRFVLLDHIRRRGSATVAELVEVLDAAGYVLNGRASKVVADSLRWEVARGRVIRRRRGVYAYGRVPKSTARRVKLFAARCRAWIVAVMRGQQPPPTPQIRAERLAPHPWMPEDPLRPPWQDLLWLWTT